MAEGSAASRLRVASYNLNGLRDDTEAAARVVRALDPDVLCLQEVPRRWLFGHRVADFAAACGLTWSGGSRGSGGTTVMTSLRVDVPRAGHERLPVSRFGRECGFGAARVRLAGHRPVTVLSLHLPLEAGLRERHARLALGSGWVREGEPLVVAGGLGGGPGGAAWDLLAAHLRAVTGPEPTVPSREPDRRIDAIFATEQLVALDPADDPPLPRLGADDLARASDHRPVATDLDLSRLVAKDAPA